MTILKEQRQEEKVSTEVITLDESSSDKSFGLQEGRNVCRKVCERAKISGGYDSTVIKDSIASVLDGLNMQILQITGKDKSSVLSKISMLLDDAYTEISKVR